MDVRLCRERLRDFLIRIPSNFRRRRDAYKPNSDYGIKQIRIFGSSLASVNISIGRQIAADIVRCPPAVRRFESVRAYNHQAL